MPCFVSRLQRGDPCLAPDESGVAERNDFDSVVRAQRCELRPQRDLCLWLRNSRVTLLCKTIEDAVAGGVGRGDDLLHGIPVHRKALTRLLARGSLPEILAVRLPKELAEEERQAADDTSPFVAGGELGSFGDGGVYCVDAGIEVVQSLDSLCKGLLYASATSASHLTFKTAENCT